MSHSLTEILKALHTAKDNAIIDIANGEVVAVYPKTDILNTVKPGQQPALVAWGMQNGKIKRLTNKEINDLCKSSEKVVLGKDERIKLDRDYEKQKTMRVKPK